MRAFYRRWASVLAAIGLLLVAVQLLEQSVGLIEPRIEAQFSRWIRSDWSALGASWLAAYLLLNGSVVAAVALSLFSVSLITAPELLLMVFGSRLGASGIVLVIGLFDFIERRRLTVRTASEPGVAAFLVTYMIGIPAAAAGYLCLQVWSPAGLTGTVQTGSSYLGMPDMIERLVGSVVAVVGPGGGLLLAIIGLILGLRLFNRLFEEAEVEQFRSRYRRWLHSQWIAFGVGLLLTALTMSTAFSLGVLVPIYNRGYLKREELIPFILGANIGTLIDTVLISLFIDMPGAFQTVLLVMGATTAATVPALLFPTAYRAVIDRLLARILAGRGSFIGFLVLLLLVPAGLMGLGWLVGGAVP